MYREEQGDGGSSGGSSTGRSSKNKEEKNSLSVRVTIITIYHCITKYQLQCFLLLHPYFFSNKPVCSAPLFYSVSESGGVTFGSRLSQGCTY